VSNATSLLGNSATTASTTGQSPRTQPLIAIITARVADIARRIGIRLFLTCDEEANWRNWQITVLSGGLARSYRDVRFGRTKPASNPDEER
jgi:hypothetical protein